MIKLNKKKGNYKMVLEFSNVEELAKALGEKFSKEDLSYLRAFLGREAARKSSQEAKECKA